MTVIGVDGCRGGWVAAVLDGPGIDWLPWTTEIRDVLSVDAASVAIDIPIGLPEQSVRACDVEARALLGRRGVSVFSAPVRPVLSCRTYAEARAVLAAAGGRSMSAQAFGLVPAVRQVDEAITAADHHRVIEAHPEVAFFVLGGDRELASKRTGAGVAGRIRLLQDALAADVVAVLAKAPAGVPVDDALDALACAYVAREWAAGRATALGDGALDSRGLPMRIVAPPRR
jgi:predicted RNase H-like nuclease